MTRSLGSAPGLEVDKKLGRVFPEKQNLGDFPLDPFRFWLILFTFYNFYQHSGLRKWSPVKSLMGTVAFI